MADVVDHYPSIPHEDGLNALSVNWKNSKTMIGIKMIYLR